VFIDSLLNTPTAEWYKSPSKNRDFVNQKVLVLSGLLSGKKTSDVDMNDIQTARLFLFNNAPEGALHHPAFTYVESFYDYQNDQGYSGEVVEAAEKTPHQPIESPHIATQPKKIEVNVVQNPITNIGGEKIDQTESPFITLGGEVQKRGLSDDAEFSV